MLTFCRFWVANRGGVAMSPVNEITKGRGVPEYAWTNLRRGLASAACLKTHGARNRRGWGHEKHCVMIHAQVRFMKMLIADGSGAEQAARTRVREGQGGGGTRPVSRPALLDEHGACKSASSTLQRPHTS
ncbi:hypothetical protein JDV02_002015 [Purpureocillium takamizusanense]|uniref:Uncharacterized protein n=1 Tax=Purpureocillium takamizusanense TaxID=2060973 RepID=A0A9Q8V8E5_9HYPO|nr:uncharacterized protein JDV02_002015 [Purpureocillium takamizusanense]UNI15486.1 hypothetical protein JDV02_002015 [Purpureocillium takamizusanense]